MKNRLEALSHWASDNLQNCIMPFWTSSFLLDEDNGGFYSRITADMQRDNDSPRGLTLSGRMVYAFSESYNVFKSPLYLQRAEYAFNDLISRFYDKEFKGGYSQVAANGEVASDEKPVYCEAFFIMACAAYYNATKNIRALEIGNEAIELMESKAKWAPSCYHNNLTRMWQPAQGMGFGKKDDNSKSLKLDFPPGAVMFPHHLCQAYVQMYKACNSPLAKAALAEMVGFIISHLYDKELHCFKTIVKNGERVGTHQSFGHDCEISYLALEAAELAGTQQQKLQIKEICIDVLYHVLHNDFDVYGSLYNGADLLRGVEEKSHVWWAQAEAVTAMLCGYELTGDDDFLTACEKQADFISLYFADLKNGDWHNNILVDENGGRIVDGMHGLDKLNSGKCPFHNSQMCFEVMRRSKKIIKGAKR